MNEVKKGKKVTILGAGNVGASIAFAMAIKGLCSEMVLVDINKPKAKGEAMDIMQGNSFYPGCDIRDGDYPDAAGSDLVVVTVGIARKPGQTRLDLCKINAKIIASVMPEITKYAPDACYVIVSNPVDVLTYEALKVSGLKPTQVIGSGTVLDSSRLRACLADHAKVSAKNVHAYVLGEHGDSSMVPWSLASVCGMPFEDYCRCVSDLGDKNEIVQEVRDAGAEVIKCKGATYYAIALSVSMIAEAVLRDTKTVLTVSALQDGSRYEGVEDVCLSLPAVIGAAGIEREVTPPLNDEDQEALRKSAKALRSVIEAMQEAE
ncbi:MAG: L-lactate dehydrogenase [Oscillospiraceae bacterium]|nr:L-lactate dehydrogenase [Oscillospiraceae bacterium]